MRSRRLRALLEVRRNSLPATIATTPPPAENSIPVRDEIVTEEDRRNSIPASIATALPPAENPIPDREENVTKKIAATKKKPAAKKTKLASTCKFAFSDKRSCSMPRWSRHRRYCLFHARQEQQLIDADQIGEELAAFSDEFRTNTDLNHALGNLFKAVAQNRIPPRNAAVLAYIGQLLQQNVPNVQNEIMRIDGHAGLNKVIRAALDAHDSCEEEDGEDDSPKPAGGRDVPNFADPEHFPVYQFHPNSDGGDWTVLTEPPPGPAPVYQFHRDGEAGHWTVLAPPQPEPAPKPTEGTQA